jgi:hypothetical protein
MAPRAHTQPPVPPIDSSTESIVWSAAETALVIIAASIPFLRTTQYLKKVAAHRSAEKTASPSRRFTFGFQGSGSSTRGLTNWSSGDDDRLQEKHAVQAGATGVSGASDGLEASSGRRAAAVDPEQGGSARVG